MVLPEIAGRKVKKRGKSSGEGGGRELLPKRMEVGPRGMISGITGTF